MIEIEHTTGSTFMRQGSTFEEVFQESFEAAACISTQPMFGDVRYQRVREEESPSRSDVCYNRMQCAPDTQGCPGNEALMPNTPVHPTADVTTGTRFNTVSIEGPWSKFNIRQSGSRTYPDVADPMAMQPFAGSGTSSGAFASPNYYMAADSIVSLVRDVNNTVDSYNQGEDIATVHPDGTAYTFVGRASSEYHAHPQLNVLGCMAAVRSKGDDHTVSQCMEPQ
jgi:hypothetical protein